MNVRLVSCTLLCNQTVKEYKCIDKQMHHTLVDNVEDVMS